ncbi:MarR family winged helix-turn-helix transcriptional regulator [Saccharomonospora saliphila]|uniref:MarR family winged helix-turn-helix transcriptional regulator n=1 Tax=Saccharomonospora saliphila TaxID=369829 RepID=UPI0003A335F1|nr:MarR family winged helix-turn-helix transcriptional regulator [Saccharomonospora saliphila]
MTPVSHGPGATEPCAAEEAGPTDALARQLVRLTRLMHRAKQHTVAPGPDGVERAAYAILFTLIERGPQRTGALAELVHSDISTVSRQCGSLVRHGLVERRADPDDGRASLLAATDEGVRVFEENRRQRNEWLGQVLADWPETDRAALTGLLDRLNTAIETCEPPGGLPRGTPGDDTGRASS